MLLISHVPAHAGESHNARVTLPTDVVPRHYDLEIELDHAVDRFSGTTQIAIDVNRATSDIVLNAVDLEIRQFSVSTSDSRTMLGMQKDALIDAARETATLHFPAPLARGRHLLRIQYSGKIHGTTTGLFAFNYETAAGPRRALFTQFEPAEARRFLPCWDEPSLKADFTLGVTVPAADMSVSNMPIVSTSNLPNGAKHIRFATTPKM